MHKNLALPLSIVATVVFFLTVSGAFGFLGGPGGGTNSFDPGAHVNAGASVGLESSLKLGAGEKQASVNGWKIQPARDSYDSSVQIKRPTCCQSTIGYGALQNQQISE